MYSQMAPWHLVGHLCPALAPRWAGRPSAHAHARGWHAESRALGGRGSGGGRGTRGGGARAHALEQAQGHDCARLPSVHARTRTIEISPRAIMEEARSKMSGGWLFTRGKLNAKGFVP